MKTVFIISILVLLTGCYSETKSNSPNKGEMEMIGSNSMNNDLFWELISNIDWNQESNDDQLKPLIEHLSRLEIRDIFEFENILVSKLYQLDGSKFAKNIDKEYSYGNPKGYFSVDYFLYVRCCVVANGEIFYSNVLKNPERMPKGLDYEPLLYVASSAYILKTKKTIDDYYELLETKQSYETFSNVELWKEK